jgi:hypothetical protein
MLMVVRLKPGEPDKDPPEIKPRLVDDAGSRQEARVSVDFFGDLAPMWASLRTAALNLRTALWGGSVRQYRPEAHYMRGPGPKWREKHRGNGEAAGFVQRPVILNDKWDR